jgi:hypothetical protein
MAIKNHRLLNSYKNISLKISITLSMWFRLGAVQIYIPINPSEVALCRPITCKLTALTNGDLSSETSDLLLRTVNSSGINSF